VNQFEPGIEITAAIHGFWKMIRSTGGIYELYDHRSDPTEQRNLADDRPSLVRDLSRSIDRSIQSIEPVGSERVEVRLDEELLRSLEALGYVE